MTFGKFETSSPYVEELYESALNGESDEETGDCQTNGTAYSLFIDFTTSVGETIHAILTEDSFGFIDSELFDTANDARVEWAKIEKRLDAFYNTMEDT